MIRVEMAVTIDFESEGAFKEYLRSDVSFKQNPELSIDIRDSWNAKHPILSRAVKPQKASRAVATVNVSEVQ